jgi:hypothetical protein
MVARQGLREAEKSRSARSAAAAGLRLERVCEPAWPSEPSAIVGFDRDGGAVLAVNVRGLVAEEDPEDLANARTADRQGIGSPRHRPVP